MLKRLSIIIIPVLIAADMAAINKTAPASQVEDTLVTEEKHDVLDGSVITSEREEKQIEGVMSGNLRLNAGSISSLPRFLGTSDILKTIQLMPGVQLSGEMDSGIYIRGGDPGQNLIMLDGAVIYSPAHLMGFFSVFNSDHISSASVLKSGIPAEYGGFASGVIDIGTVNSLKDHVSGVLNLGIISSQGTLTVPIGKKSQVTASGRGSYINWMLKGISVALNENQKMPEYGLQDCNLTWLTEFDEANTLKINGYYGRDNLYFLHNNYSVMSSMDWDNIAASVIWDSHPEDKAGNRHILSFSRFSNDIAIERSSASLRMPSDITDFAYKGRTTFSFRNSRLSFGGNYTYHITNVQYPDINGLNDMIDDTEAPDTYRTHEFGLYADWSMWFSFPLTVGIGLRYSGAVTRGHLYTGPEPRISLSWNPRTNMRLRASLTSQRQYMNMVSISGMGMPTDFWIPVTGKIRPQTNRSASVGFSHSLWNGLAEYSIEPYFSLLGNVLEYDGELFEMINRKYDTEEHIISGKGRNYGVEMMVKKNRGKINGWLSYTLSRSERSFPDIMDGAVFPAKHDRRHNLSVVANYQPSEHWTFSAVFVYATGSAYTPPVGIYILGENMIQEYGPHNSARMPDYHRLDVSATYEFKSAGRFRHSLNVSVYNVYARRNPLYRDLQFHADSEDKTFIMELKNISLYSLVPSLSYTFKF